MTRPRQQHRFLKGALVEVPVDQQPDSPLDPIYFQFNPETLERVKSGQWTSAQSQRQKAEDTTRDREFRRLRGKKVKAGFVPQPEKINLTLRLDAVEKVLTERLAQEGKKTLLAKNLEALRWGYDHG